MPELWYSNSKISFFLLCLYSNHIVNHLFLIYQPAEFPVVKKKERAQSGRANWTVMLEAIRPSEGFESLGSCTCAPDLEELEGQRKVSVVWYDTVEGASPSFSLIYVHAPSIMNKINKLEKKDIRRKKKHFSLEVKLGSRFAFYPAISSFMGLLTHWL